MNKVYVRGTRVPLVRPDLPFYRISRARYTCAIRVPVAVTVATRREIRRISGRRKSRKKRRRRRRSTRVRRQGRKKRLKVTCTQTREKNFIESLSQERGERSKEKEEKRERNFAKATVRYSAAAQHSGRPRLPDGGYIIARNFLPLCFRAVSHLRRPLLPPSSDPRPQTSWGHGALFLPLSFSLHLCLCVSLSPR